MTEVITIVDPGSQPWWALSLLALLPIGGLIFSGLIDFDDEGAVFGVGLVGGAIALLIWTLIMSGNNGDAWEKARIKSLQNEGYSQVEFTRSPGHEFNAVKDGDRVRGLLLDVENSNNLEYQIVIVPPVNN